MSFTNNYPQDTAINYDHDVLKVQFISGSSKLIATSSNPDAYIYTRLDTNQGIVAIDSSGNNRHGAFQGSMPDTAWGTGKINSGIDGQGVGFINFDGFGDFPTSQAFSLAFWVKHTGTTTQAFFGKQSSSTFQGYVINAVSGILRWVVRDALGNAIILEDPNTTNDGNWHLAIGTYDGTGDSSGVKMYVDNVLVTNYSATDTLAGSIKSTANLQISGLDSSNSPMLSGSAIDECAVYDRELSPAEVSFIWNSGSGTQTFPGGTTSFPVDNPTVTMFAGIKTTTLTDFDATVVETGSDAIKFSVSVNAVQKYWDGAAWTTTDGTYAQTNTLAEVKANIGTLISELSTINVLAWFHSDDGSTTPELSLITLTYELIGTDTDVSTTTVIGTEYNIDGTVSTEIIEVELSANALEYGATNQIRSVRFIVEPNILGEWFIALADNDSMVSGSYYTFNFKNKTANRVVPKTDSINFNDLVAP